MLKHESSLSNQTMSQRPRILVVGDIHGKLSKYHNLIHIHQPEQSIQLGDFGFSKEHEWFLRTMDCQRHKVLLGNHDDYTYLHREHSLGDVSVLHDGEMMTIRGGYSIDKLYRTIGVDWWAEEEMDAKAWDQCIELYERTRPNIVLSHECPTEPLAQMFGISSPSYTAKGLQVLFDIHQPTLWVFGHHHKNKQEGIRGTEFICLAEGASLWI